MRTIELALGSRAYTIAIGSRIRFQWENFAPYVNKKVVIVTNTTVGPLYLNDIKNVLLSNAIETIEVVLPDGEQYKDWQTLNQIFDALLEGRCERSTPLIALGGGVIGDMTGFAAACYQRGAPFIQIPTTLLSQVDSSVGGKTAINHPLGKNMIGAFYQPRFVLIDIETLSTLPDRELSAGLAEVIKYGLIRDPEFFAWLECNIEGLRGKDPALLKEAVERSCKNKAQVVVADETEQGERALLNLGHTFGHAIETGMGYGTWLHGEAVAVGCVMATDLSAEIGWIDKKDLARVESIFKRAGLPTEGPSELSPETYLDLMSHDKKVVDGRIRLILLKEIGKGVVSDQVPEKMIQEVIAKRTRL